MLRPLQLGRTVQREGQAVPQSVEVRTYTAQVTPTTRQLTPQEARRIASIGWNANYTNAANSNNLGITTGGDGRMWFCENGAGTSGKIGALSTSGVLTEYAIPPVVYNNTTYYFYPLYITTAAGKLWFTSGSAIGSFSTSGAFQGFYFLTSGFQIATENFSTLVTGSDGNLWTLDYGNPNKIWRITTGGTFTYALLPTSNALQNASPGLISVPGGDLYFTEYNKNAIMRWSTSFSYTEYPIGIAGSNPVGITNGPDGNIWFTQAASSGTSGYLLYLSGSAINGYTLSNKPGVIATQSGSVWYLASGTINQFTPGGSTLYTYNLPAGSATGAGITAGGNSALWFTGGPNGGNVVTKFTTL